MKSMNLKVLKLFVASTGLACVVGVAAVRGDAPAAGNDAVKQEIDGYLKALDAANPDDRNAAELAIENLTAADVPVIADLSAHLELSVRAKGMLATAMARLEPRTKLKVKRQKQDLEVTDWMRSAVLMDARMHGRRTAWLEPVEKVIALDIQRSKATRASEYLAVQSDERKQIDAALAAGCQDPAFFTLDGLFTADEGEAPAKVYSLFKQAREKCTGLQVSPYMMFVMNKRILWGMASGLDGGITAATHPEVNKRYCEMADMAGALVRNTDTPMQVRIQVVDLMIQTAEKLNGKFQSLYDFVFAPLEKMAPDDAQVLYLKGKFYCELAWGARGNGWANSVTPQQWKDFAARLQISSDALNKSYEKDPDDPAAATQMIIVVMGQDADAGTMEKWFKRAMDTDPDNLQACYNKMYYLEPKWHNDPAGMLEFGYQSLKSANWHTSDMPLLITEAHIRLSKYEADPAAYWHKASVWDDLQAAYTAAMEIYPKSTRLRSIYCFNACRCGQWKEADAQFKLLGEKVDASVFGGDAVMQMCRRNAATVGGQ